MKKIVLLALALGIGFATYAQAYRFKIDAKHQKRIEAPAIGIEPVKSEAVVKSNIQKKQVTPPADRDVNIVTIVDIGTAANAYGYGYAGGQKSLVWVDPDLNTFTNFHRMGGALDPGGYSGDLGYDISTDGGQTFTNMIECYRATNNNGGTYYADAARYPNHGIYNPEGNTDPANAYVVFFAPVLDQSNGSGWGGYGYGVANIGDTSYHTKHLLASHDDYYQYIPDAYELTHDFSIAVDVNQDWTSGTMVYQGNLILNTAHWDENANDFLYSQDLLDAPVEADLGRPVFTQVAFSQDGQTGYIVMLGDDGSAEQPGGFTGLYPIYWKSTDGGESWDGPSYIQLDGPNGIGGIVYHHLTDTMIANLFEPPVPAREDINYTTAFDFNCAVDNNGNLHIAVVIGPTWTDAYSILTLKGYFAVVDIFTDDGGTTWFAEEMGRPQNFRGNFGDLSEDNRVQITTSPDHSKIFISWLDTDIEDAEENNQPNIFCRGFDPATYMKTNDGSGNDAPTNVTLFSAGMWQAYFYAAPKYCFENNGSYNIPFVYENMDPNDPGQPVQFEYIQDFAYTDADFTIQGVSEHNISTSNNASVSQNFPNPFNGTTYVNVSLKEGNDVSLGVYTLTGQEVSVKDYGYLTAGSHNLTISSDNLPTGVYFYTVKIGDQKITRKMVVR
jgi:hypothetical protein